MGGIVQRMVVVELVALCFERSLGRGTIRVFEKPVISNVMVQRGVYIGVRSSDECHCE